MSLSALCLECGLCCDGTLFRQVKISLPEREALVQLGIGVGLKSRHPVMWLPCGQLEGKCCTVYSQRPGGCRRFVCALGKRMEAGEVSVAEAHGAVREMHEAIARLKAAFSTPERVPVLRHARECIDSPTQQVSEEQLAAFNAVEARRYRDFMPPS